MQITMRPMTPEEAWDYIFNGWNLFHKILKHFGYTKDIVAINAPMLQEMFDRENLTEQEVVKYRDIFINQIYDVKDLQKFDDIFEKKVKPNLENAINRFLVPLIPSWNAVMLKQLDILCAYGVGGSGYRRISDDVARINFRMSESLDNEYGIFNILFHEFVHLLIEEPIIKKYHVPQDLKERIVDIICYEFVKIPVCKTFENSFANNYITPEVIKTNLPVVVQKMMADYAVVSKHQSGYEKQSTK